MDQSLGALFSGKSVWTNGRESSSKVSPEMGIGPWMALPRNYPLSALHNSCPDLFFFWPSFFRVLGDRGNVLQVVPEVIRDGILGKEKSARSFLPEVFCSPPGVMDVCAFGSWTSARTCLCFQGF